MIVIRFFLCTLFTGLVAFSAVGIGLSEDGEPLDKYLLLDMNVQIEATEAVNDMYNFKFESADKQFNWLKQKYGWHPLPYFLLGLSQWWRMIPNLEVEDYDEPFLAYIDTAIYLADRLYERNENNVEAAFFLAAAYGFQGRLHAERRDWGKAATAGKNAIKYMKVVRGNEDFSPELLFGDALYNYYAVWVRENYPWLKPFLVFFRSGDKDKGIAQLREVALNAFYTRTEAQYFLMRILNEEKKEKAQALQVAEYLHQTFPDNPYFHRYYTRLLYQARRFKEVEKEALQIIAKIDNAQTGYEAISGRYAAFFLGQVYEASRRIEESKHYYQRAVEFGEAIGAVESGYYLYSLLSLAEYKVDDGDIKGAKELVKKIKKNAKRSERVHKEARDLI